MQKHRRITSRGNLASRPGCSVPRLLFQDVAPPQLRATLVDADGRRDAAELEVVEAHLILGDKGSTADPMLIHQPVSTVRFLPIIMKLKRPA